MNGFQAFEELVLGCYTGFLAMVVATFLEFNMGCRRAFAAWASGASTLEPSVPESFSVHDRWSNRFLVL